MCDALCAPAQRSKSRRILTSVNGGCEPADLDHPVSWSLLTCGAAIYHQKPALRNVIVVLSAHIVNDMLRWARFLAVKRENPGIKSVERGSDGLLERGAVKLYRSLPGFSSTPIGRARPDPETHLLPINFSTCSQ